jgi:hypothetical protein
MHGELAGPGAEDVAGNPDVVSQVEQLVELEALLSDGIQTNVDLQPLTALLQLGKAGLALGADGHDAPGNRDHRPLRVQHFRRDLSELLAHFRNRVRSDKLVGVGCWPSAEIWRSLSWRSAKRLLSNSDSNNGCLSPV